MEGLANEPGQKGLGPRFTEGHFSLVDGGDFWTVHVKQDYLHAVIG
jgi:hypothetical protein